MKDFKTVVGPRIRVLIFGIAAAFSLLTCAFFAGLGSNDAFPVRQQREYAEPVDVQIGVRGATMRSERLLITFDPSERELKTDRVHRFPFIVSDIDGVIDFTHNKDNPYCSSVNRRNEHYDKAYLRERMMEMCNATMEDFMVSNLPNCMHPKETRSMEVPSVRLSTFLKSRNITAVHDLQIDAQGSDFTILKDTVENCPKIRFNKVTVECQLTSQAPAMYLSSNDCDDIAKYVKRKFPNAVIKTEVNGWGQRIPGGGHRFNNCMVAEHNLIASNLGYPFTSSR